MENQEREMEQEDIINFEQFEVGRAHKDEKLADQEDLEVMTPTKTSNEENHQL